MAEIACNLLALLPDQRDRRAALAAKAIAAVTSSTELPSGFSLRLDPQLVTAGELDELAGLEGRCCPFLHLAARAGDGGLLLEITGSRGVKDFIRAQFGLRS